MLKFPLFFLPVKQFMFNRSVPKLFNVLALALMLLSGAILAQETTELDGEDWQNNFDQLLVDLLLETGRALVEQGNLIAAEKIYAEALQVAKINHGLLSEKQFDALVPLLEILIEQEKWLLTNQQLAYFEWLNGKVNALNSEKLLDGIATLNRLYLAAAAHRTDSESGWYLVAAKNLSWRAVSLIQLNFGNNSLKLPPWLYQIVLNHYYQSSLNQRQGLTSYNFKTDEQAVISGWSLSRIEAVQKNYNIGFELLNRIREIYGNLSEASAEQDGLMLVYLADWELLYGRHDSALRYYQEASTALLNNGVDKQEVEKYFRSPVFLPVAQLYAKLPPGRGTQTLNVQKFVVWAPAFPGINTPQDQYISSTFRVPENTVSARFSLSASMESGESSCNGGNALNYRVTDVQITDLDAEKEIIRERLTRDISALHLRPPMLDGKLLEMEGLRLQYSFPTESNYPEFIPNP